MSGAMSCCRLAAAALRPLSSVQRGRSAAGEWGRGGPGSARASAHLPASGGTSGTGPACCERSATRARFAERPQRVLTRTDAVLLGNRRRGAAARLSCGPMSTAQCRRRRALVLPAVCSQVASSALAAPPLLGFGTAALPLDASLSITGISGASSAGRDSSQP